MSRGLLVLFLEPLTGRTTMKRFLKILNKHLLIDETHSDADSSRQHHDLGNEVRWLGSGGEYSRGTKPCHGKKGSTFKPTESNIHRWVIVKLLPKIRPCLGQPSGRALFS